MRFDDYYFKEDKLDRWEELQSQSEELRATLKVIKKLNDAGYEGLIVGGACRDFILGKMPDDFDITTNATPDEVEQIFGKAHDIGKNKSMGVVIVKQDGFTMEVATYRTDSYNDITKGLGADKVELTTSFKDDSSRRDLTCNALGIDIDGNIIDFHNGIEHIKNKIISTVGDPNLRFKEDQVRQLRAVRLSSRLGFSIDDKTMRAIQSNAPEIKKVAGERIAKELLKMAEQTGSKFADSIETLDKANLLQYILPEVYGLKSMMHNKLHHPEGGSTVLGHVLEALRTNKVTDMTLNMSILCHDLGKLTTHGPENSYHGHASAAVPLIEKMVERLHLDNNLRDAMIFCAEQHMKISEITSMSNNKLFQLINNKYFDLLMKVAEADWKSRGEKMFDQQEWNDIQNKIASIKEKYANNDALTKIKKVVNGNLVMRLKGYTPADGKKIGDVIKKTTEFVLDNNISLEDTETINKYIESL